MTLNREDILAAIKARKADVTEFEVVEWGGTVYIKKLNVAALEATGMLEGGDNQNVAKLAVSLIVVGRAEG